ncbi:uncharacterized protein LOC142107846 isoform X2 [Mixophyes fleayi]|uniref:uncharacterized protein LOC142107846 isoform X2 n=1 Tax=Mixophyes fleayi TaxID=3061075 RepID=UPI003F4DD12F
MGSDVSLVCALLLLLHYGREGAALDVTTTSTGSFLTGDNITLPIYYNSTESATVIWTVNGTAVANWMYGVLNVLGKYKGRLTITDIGSLLINSTYKSDAGTYSVTVTILDKTAESLNITSASTGSFVTGDNITLLISYNSNNSATVTWAVNGIVAANWKGGVLQVSGTYADRLNISNNGSLLIITNTSKSDAGNYSVTVAVDGMKPGTRDFPVTFSDPSSLSVGAIVGIVVGSVLGAILLVALIVLLVICIRRRKNAKKEKNPPGPRHKEVIPTVSRPTLSRDDPAPFTVNNTMSHSSSISRSSAIINSRDYTSNRKNHSSPNPLSSPSIVSYATSV